MKHYSRFGHKLFGQPEAGTAVGIISRIKPKHAATVTVYTINDRIAKARQSVNCT
jgi:hypothetical protein